MLNNDCEVVCSGRGSIGVDLAETLPGSDSLFCVMMWKL